MKKINLMSILAISLLLLTNCKKTKETVAPVTPTTPSIAVAQVNTPIYGKLTATWCGPCGAWGWTMNDEILNNIGSKAIPMGVYGSASSKFTNATVNKWFTDFGGQSYPNFTVNGVNKTEFSGNSILTTTTKTNIYSSIDAFIASPVIASAGGNFSWEGQKLTVKSAVKFFQAQTGEFYVGAYMIEDKAKMEQASQTGIVEHHHVCHGSMSSEIYGPKFAGSMDAGQQTTLSDFTFTVPSTVVKENVYVAIMIWKKVGTKYTFVNAAKISK